ncbi:MAG: TIGR03943 family protein [Eubacteriales bacterium]
MRKCGEELVWYVVLIVLSIIVGGLLISGEILLYLAPRMLPMVWFGLVVLVILTIYQFIRLGQCFGESGKGHAIHLKGLVFLIPIVLMLTAMPNEDTVNALPNRNVQMGTLVAQSSSATVEDTATKETKKDTLANAQSEPAQETDAQETEAEAEKNVKIATGDMGVQSDGPIDPADAIPCVYNEGKVPFGEGGDLFNEYIYNTTEELVGQTITVYGFVYTEETFPEDVILISRLCFWCCAADSYVIGFYVKVEDADAYSADDWICVTGVVESITMDFYGDDFDFPLLTDGTITYCDIPNTEEAYIYP